MANRNGFGKRSVKAPFKVFDASGGITYAYDLPKMRPKRIFPDDVGKELK